MPKPCHRGLTTCLSQQQESYYSTLLDARQEALKLLKEGAVIKDVFNHVQSFVQEKSSTLGEAYVKTMGFAVSFCYGFMSF